ncbi:hypothetical protein PFICI_15334 [Pestalotiopsis fici W106-1]|uniref:Zn(2)-C6 fungal-type domain-containing protein n=1 Tax=Pestalotiopsis fici (strain W106-1 / CGMCC3.15140) TaxID=1229662 RepID=W3WIG6_PESFW|nr:uncharacterized protein PFICI_15334 [Pestalotiopsis fici W106-1]ETS72942.1 hypothetical protein PFICI_15334 [Pestalotiopsis fici W106-1]
MELTDDASALSSHGSSDAAATGLGQVCDRCRQKKVKCDAALPSCGSCLAAGVLCEKSAKLRRRTKIRGYQINMEDQLKRAQAENAELKRLLQAEREANTVLRRQNQGLMPGSLEGPDIPETRTALLSSTSGKTRESEVAAATHEQSPTVLIQHMGRLVTDQMGTQRFAGTTTGIHFVLSTQQAIKTRMDVIGWFPESCFRLYLLQMPIHEPAASILGPGDILSLEDSLRLFGRLCPHTPSYYAGHVHRFITSWSAYCPIIAASDFQTKLTSLLERSQQGLHELSITDVDCCIAFQLVIILLINNSNIDARSAHDFLSDRDIEGMGVVSRTLFIRMMQIRTQPSLQGLLLLGLYFQLTGQNQHMIQLSGLNVQFAHSLGLHRHSRRFTYCASEIELRRRIWWCVYIYDKMAAITHGLPKLINDSNVDIDMPVDCDLQVVTATDLTYPLPGESTPIRDFNHFVHLNQLFSSVLTQLYTTTDRRGGPEKMERLSAALQSWEQRFIMHSHDFSSALPAPPKDSGLDPAASVLPLMAEVARLLIHRPGLTFDPGTPPFRQCLDVCTEASTNIINIASKRTGCKTLNIIYPPICGLIFQSALMHVFYYCHAAKDHMPESSATASSAEIIQKAIGFLDWTMQSQNREGQDSGDTGRSVGQALQLLRAILQVLPVLADPSSYVDDSIDCGIPGNAGSASQQPGPTLPAHELNTIFDELMCSPLEGNDLMGSLDWLLDTEFSPWASR